MAIPISDIHDDIRSQLKKYNSAFVSPGDIDIAVNKAQKETAAVQSYLKDYATSLGSPAAFAGKQIGEVISNPGKAVDKSKDAFDWLKGLVK